MAAAITTAATTIEQQAFEIGHKLRQAIADYNTANPDAPATGLSAGVTLNVAAGTFSININGPLAQTADPDGGISFDAAEVMTL